MYTHRLADRCVKDPEWVEEFLKYVDENPNSCHEVWLCSKYAFPSIETHRETARLMKPTVEMFKSRGIRVALQISNTIGGHSGTKFSDNSGLVREDWHAPFFVNEKGEEHPYRFCVRSQEFKDYVSAELEAYLSELDVCGVWIDDDFRMGNHTQSCWCDSCIEEFSRRENRRFSREELVKLVNDDFEVRDAWIKFTSDRFHDAALFMAEAVHRAKPDAYMALQHGANGYMQGAGHTAAFEGFFEGSGVVPHSRPGGGSYEDFNPNTFIVKYRWLSHQTRYLPEYVKDIRPEIENLPDVCYGKTLGGQIFETALYFAGGATSMSYATMMRRNEPLSWLCLQLRDMSQNFEWFSRLSEVNKNTRAGGAEIYIPQRPWNYKTEKPFEWENIDFDSGCEIIRCGIPMTLQKIDTVYLLHHSRVKAMSDDELKEMLSKNVVCDGETAAIITERGLSHLLGVCAEKIVTGKLYEKLSDEFNWAHNFFHPYGARIACSDNAEEITAFYNNLTGEHEGTASAYTVTALGGRWAVVGYCLFNHVISFAKRNKILEALEWAGGKLPAKLTTPDKMIIFPRVDQKGKVLSVSFVNTSVGACETSEVCVDGEYEKAEWYSIGEKKKEVATRILNGSTYITLPHVNGWSVGTLFLN